MKSIRVLTVLAIFASFRGSLAAQTPQAAVAEETQRLAEQGAAAGQVTLVDEAIAVVERALQSAPTDTVLLHYLGYAYYRKGTILAVQGRRADASHALDQAEASLRRAAKSLTWPENAALLGATIGQKIGLNSNPFSAMRNGPRSNAELDRAVQLGPNNPRVLLLRGIGAYYKPKLFGGGPEKAAEELERALAAFESDKPLPSHPSWGHGEAWTFLGLVRTRQGRIADARAAYERALTFTPLIVSVRDSLLPALVVPR
ncbi:MAG: tetratricopeptide repeat protein [Gemmatimonadaceae bacterium]